MVSALQYEINQYKNQYFFDVESKWTSLEENEVSDIVMDMKTEFQKIIENIVFQGHNVYECSDEYCYQCLENLQDLKVYVPAYEALYNFAIGEITIDHLCTFLSNSTMEYYINYLWMILPDYLRNEYGYLRVPSLEAHEEEEEEEDSGYENNEYLV